MQNVSSSGKASESMDLIRVYRVYAEKPGMGVEL
jgi:hypothetical protein